ncbi:MAG: HlyD family efflux transporter periplasmic adaptor subunit [Selenomonadaceae bacterium]|nr:HlyD family efflux transporter periplasmic adaptor subunit [Selenomonadaceae bacterium]MDY3917091.1 HlyD family efflux transporter periplasmic adaptor subunit [Selenomonadaceae bacterium]
MWYAHEQRIQAEASQTLTLSGNVDVREVSVAFRQSDRIAEILAAEGDTVQAGQVLARLDDHELQLQRAKADAQVRAQQSTVDKLHNGTRQEEIAQAQAQYDAAQAAAENARGVYSRYQQIYTSIEGISEQQLDNARHDYEAKSASAAAAQQTLAQALNGARAEDIAAGEAALEADKDEAARLAYVLSQYELRAPADGVIRSRLLQPGDMASPSAPVFKLSLLDKKWVRAYVSETDLGKIYEGQAALVSIDSQKEPVQGQIGYISDTAEFTPKNVQTDELRTALVYEIRVYVDDPDNVLRMGMPATVKVNL